MKTGRRLVLGAAVATVAAAVLAQSNRNGLVRSGDYVESDPGGLFQQVAVESSAADVYDVGPYAASPPDLPRTEGVDTVEVYCQICHSNTYITMQPPLSAETWEAEVKKMVETHGASIPEDDAREILAYLKANFTPETRKK